MAAARFMDVALRNTTGPLSLSYTHEQVKWHVRRHACSLVGEFPTLKLSVEPFTYDDGTTVNLVHASGVLPLPSSPVHLSVWIHQSYPFVCPLVYLFSPPPSSKPVVHPFVDSSTGMVMTPYLLTWESPGSNLSDLVRNLVRILKFWPPFFGLQFHLAPRRITASSSSPSKREAIDRLAMYLLHDMEAANAKAMEEIESASTIQSVLQERALLSSSMVSELKNEKLSLEERVDETKVEVGKVSKWLEDNDVSSFQDYLPEEAFKPVDDKSKLLIEHKAADEGIHWTMRALEVAVGKGVVPLDAYLKQVRSLAKEQFYHRSMQMEAIEEPRFFISSINFV